MSRRSEPPRIALISGNSTDLAHRLEASIHQPVVQPFRDLYADAHAIRSFEPTALFATGSFGESDIGALRLLRALMPETAVVLVTDAGSEVATRELGDRIGATVLLESCSRAELTRAVDGALHGAERLSAEALLDLARGISDEINNPLMFVGGHLQLLAGMLAEVPEGLEQLHRVQEGLARVSATMAKVRLLSRAGDLNGELQTVSLTDLIAEQPDHADAARFHSEVDRLEVRGDRELLRALLTHLGEIAVALSHDGTPPTIHVEAAGGEARIHTVLATDGLPAWHLPRTFEPYYLSRILRGTPHGLNLFLIQIVAHAHGGSALVHWVGSDRLQLAIGLPGRPGGDSHGV